MRKLSEAKMRVLRLAYANRPRSVPVKADDRTILGLERDYLIAATSFAGTYTVTIMSKGIEIVEAEKAAQKKVKKGKKRK